MHVLDAIAKRRSIRAFKPDPVPRKTLNAILEAAQRSPSGTNTQPWRTYVCAGAVKDAITRDVLQDATDGVGHGYEEYGYYPDAWKDHHRDRRRGVGWSLYGLLGIQKGDRQATARQGARNFLFFDAPVGLFITVESYLLKGSWADVGMYAQTLMLAAQGHGVDTCPQAAWIPFSETVKRHLSVPEDEEIVTGMSLGYADWDKIENTLVSDREEMQEVTTFLGFD